MLRESAKGFIETPVIADLVAKANSTDRRAPVVIFGEPGVGKDTLATLIHESSPRGGNPFIKVNCAAHQADRHEVELFGCDGRGVTVEGRRRLGSVEFAHRGTLYLDEMEALSPSVASTLFDTLRRDQVSRMGDDRLISVDVRMIASTTRESTMRNGDFWPRLCSLGAIEIWIPPLRCRRDEIPIFTSFFLAQWNLRYRRRVQVSPETISALRSRSWPGNLAELAETVRRYVLSGPAATVPWLVAQP